MTTHNIASPLKWLTISLAFFVTTSISAKELIFADSFPITHPLSIEGDVYWMKRVEELTNGEITFKYFPAEQMAKAAGILQKIKDGVADAGYIGIGYVTSDMPLNNGIMLPGLVTNVISDSAAYWNLLNNDDSLIRKEFIDNDVVPIWGAVMAPYQIGLTKAPIETMDDFKGLKLRTTGSLSLLVSSLGANPITMSAPDAYLAMQRGTVDGTLHTYLSLDAYKLRELVKSVTKNADFGTFALTAAISKKVYDELTEEQKKAIKQAGDETSVHVAQIMGDIEIQKMNEMKDDGVIIYDLSDDVLDKLMNEFETTQQQWVDRMKKQGLSGEKALEDIKQAMDAESN